MADDSVAIQPSDPSTTTVADAPSPMIPYGQTAAQFLGGVQQQQAQNPPPPPNATAPLNMPTAAPYMSTPTPPDVKEHMSWINRAVTATANALAGPTSWQVTKQPDGTVTSTPMPSTNKEKWGQIAAAALTGAAQGFLNSQGPGGIGKAGAAGVLSGLKQLQQQKEQSQADADFQNKEMTANANRIHIGQQTYMLAQQAKLADLQYDDATAKAMNDTTQMLMNSPGAVDLGAIDPTDHDQLMNLSKANPDVMPAIMGQGGKVMRYGLEADHKMHMIMTDKGYEQQRNTTPIDVPTLGWDGDKPVTLHQTVPANGDTMGSIYNTIAANSLKIGTAQKNYADQKEKEAAANKPPPVPNNYAATVNSAALEKDPDKRAALLDSANKIKEEEIEKAAAGRERPQGPPPSDETLSSWAQAVSDPRSNVSIAQVPAAQRGFVLNYMTAHNMQPTHPLTNTEINRYDLSKIGLSNIEAAQQIVNKRPDLFSAKGWASNAFKNALAKNDPDAANFQMAMKLANIPTIGIHGVKAKWAADELTKLDSTFYTSPEAMTAVLGDIHDSLTNITQNGGRLGSYNTGPAAAPAAPAAAKPAAAAPAQAPAAKPAQPTYKAGDVIPSADGKSHVQLLNNKWVPVVQRGGVWTPQ